MACRASRRTARRASDIARQRLATNLGATRTATTLVGQPSAAIARATPAAVPPVPRGRTMVSGGSGVWVASSSPASRCPATARGWAPPPAIQRRAPSAPARLQRRAYLFAQQRRIRRVNPDPADADAGCHGLHPPRRARRPQVRGRPARWHAPFPTAGRRILQDAGQGAGGDRRGPGRAQQARVSYIHTPAALADAVATLRREPLVAADTEAASFHRYHDRIFLVQLASPSLTAIIDPLAIADLSPVGGLLDDPKVEKIFHDADYDLRILDRDYGFRARRLFDTRVAAQLAGEPAVGLAA